MLTYEDVTAHLLQAAAGVKLVTHPEYWMNTRTLEREFACTCHIGPCEEAEQQSSCTISFTWGPLDTSLSLEGPAGVCDFFHESEQDCEHLHTRAIPPLVIDLAYTLALNGAIISDNTLLSLAQVLKLCASEHSQRTVETRPGVNMILQDNALRPDAITLQQRVELPIWHPEGMRGLHDDPTMRPKGRAEHSHQLGDDEGDEMVVADDPHPEEWLPQVLVEVCQDIMRVLHALNATVSYNLSDNAN
jgi:hypothetical protein